MGVAASNWAQTTGPQLQTTAVPYIPSKQHAHWSGRMGHAVAVTNTTNSGEKVFEAESWLFVVGGDDFPSTSEFDEHNTMHGLRNDVWRVASPPYETFYIKTDATDRTPYDHALPEQWSTLQWEMVSAGLVPYGGETYEEFIQCQENYPVPRRTRDCADHDRPSWFSPRRNHQLVAYEHKLFVIGGRAREHAMLAHDRAVGGIVDPRPQQSPDRLSTWRETSVLKNDVWVSETMGQSWRLVEAGCRSNQLELLLLDKDGAQLAPMFNSELRCTQDSDCYGNQEYCQDNVCVCGIWSPREQHRVAVFGHYMYLVGGFASTHESYCDGRACGDLDASGYREYMNDVWFSPLSRLDSAGATWQPLSTGAAFSGRGGHALVVMQLLGGRFALGVLGGETGDTFNKSKCKALNDVWYAVLPESDAEDPIAVHQQYGWQLAFKHSEWPPRKGHVAVVDPPSANNGFTQRVFVVGGANQTDALLGDVWSWGWECRASNDGLRYVDGECTTLSGGGTLVNGSKWRRDYTSDGLFRMDSAANFIYDEGQPQRFYVDADSPLEHLVKVYLPLSPNDASSAEEYGYPSRFVDDPGTFGVVPRRKRVIDDARLSMLHSLGIRTIRDLAEATRDDLLALRGYPASSFDYDDVCDHRQLAIAVITKCTVQTTLNELTHYDQEAHMPWNVVPEFKGKTPVGKCADCWKARWYNKWFNKSVPLDDEVVQELWDGCEHIGHDPVAVPGVGDVPLPPPIRDPYREVQELVCKANPGPRAYFAGAYFDQKVYVMGGMVDAVHLKSVADMWYRDDYLPRAFITKKPRTLNFRKAFAIFESRAEDLFIVKPDKEGAIVEHLLMDAWDKAIVRTWDKTKRRASMRWLDYWYKGGPGTGRYTFYARAIDPAGNIDVSYSRFNMHKWKYNTALPWHIIGGTVGGFVGLCLVIWLEHKRRKRKKAMERYAIKRMRRKFKGKQRELAMKGGVDWKAMLEKDKQRKKSSKHGKHNAKKLRDLKEKDKAKAAQAAKDKDRIKAKLREKEALKAKHE